MNIERLVTMANQIEAFFRAEPDPAVAIDGIATHLRRFWAPPMREAIVAYAAAGGTGLGELVKAAVLRL